MSPIGSKIDFKGDPIFESAVIFFVIILKFIFTSIFEIKIHEKKFLETKKISVRFQVEISIRYSEIFHFIFYSVQTRDSFCYTSLISNRLKSLNSVIEKYPALNPTHSEDRC